MLVRRWAFRYFGISEGEKQPQAGSLRSDESDRMVKRARPELEDKTGRRGVAGENFLPPTKTLRRLNYYESQCLTPLTSPLTLGYRKEKMPITPPKTGVYSSQ